LTSDPTAHRSNDAERRRQRELVRSGYDAISALYRDDRGRSNVGGSESTTGYETWLGELAAFLPTGASVLDLGCGAGVPASRILVDYGLRVTGLDISGVQIRRARSLVPEATFLHADMATWNCDADSFDAIITLYALIHVPLVDQRRLFPRMTRWLRPGGYLLAIVGHQSWTAIEDYMGAPMFWEHADTPTYLAWLQEAGMLVLWHRIIPEGTSNHTLVLAQKR
jgi:SAM-dependent methyltransferase